MSLVWQHDEDFDPLSEEMIRGAELLLGVSFPPDYRECLRNHHGAYPSPAEFVVPVQDRPFRSGLGPLLSVDPRSQYFSMFEAIPPLIHEHGLPPEIIPISENGGGDFVCLDYRGDATRSNPTVVYWHHEVGGIDGITPLCATFNELLAALQPDEDPE